jgi:MarR family transcriptional regulator, organic hydroperoxide resistance regulator
VSHSLQEEIKQHKPFESIEQEVVLNVMRTASDFRKGIAEVLKPFDLTAPQYNILRILRGAPEGGLPCSEVGERLVSRDPDVTRLLDRLEKRGFVTRGRSTTDRRVVSAKITRAGHEIVDKLDAPVSAAHEAQLAHMKKKDLRVLVELLEEARRGIE